MCIPFCTSLETPIQKVGLMREAKNMIHEEMKKGQEAEMKLPQDLSRKT